MFIAFLLGVGIGIVASSIVWLCGTDINEDRKVVL